MKPYVYLQGCKTPEVGTRPNAIWPRRVGQFLYVRDGGNVNATIRITPAACL